MLEKEKCLSAKYLPQFSGVLKAIDCSNSFLLPSETRSDIPVIKTQGGNI